MAQEKKEQRKEMLARLHHMPEDQHRQKSEAAAMELYRTPEWISSAVIGITVSRGKELDTHGIIERAWAEGKRVAVPKCNPLDRTMEFRFIEDWGQLEQAYMDLKEPIVEKTSPAQSDDIDLMVVPGVIFDHQGYRIGYGGGYFDRYLRTFCGKTVSVLFEEQLVLRVMVEKFDVPVQKLVMPKSVRGIYNDR